MTQKCNTTRTPIAERSDDALISLAEFSDFLSRSKASIYRDIRAKRIDPPIKIGRSSRWRVGYARSLTRSMEGA